MAAARERRRSFSSSRVEARRRRRRIGLTLLLVLLLVGMGVGAWYLTRLPALTIAQVEVHGGVTVDTVALRERIEQVLDARYFFFVPKRFVYTYPHDALVALLEAEPRVARASMMREERTLSVRVVEHVPIALWCADPGARAGCVFLAEDGEAFDVAPYLAGVVLRRYVTEERAPEVGVAFASSTFLADTEAFAEALAREHGMRAGSVTRTQAGDVRYRIVGGGEVVVAANAAVEEVFANLDSILGSAEFKHLEPGNFAYIDLRFGNKVFVKESLATTSTSTALTEE